MILERFCSLVGKGRKAMRVRWCVGLLGLAFALTSCLGGGVDHRVRKGETLWRIAHTYDVSMSRVIRANHIKDPTDIRAGTRLYIPGAKKTLRVPPAEASSRPGPAQSSRAVSTRNEPLHYRGGFQWPLRGRLLRTFGKKDGIRNDGIDIRAGRDTPVRAANDGEVVYVADSFQAYGKIIIIKHEHDIYTVYANNKVNAVKRGERVKKGEVIARAGVRDEKDVFIHFEVREGKRPVNPLFFLP